jgi:hypothetical protein
LARFRKIVALLRKTLKPFSGTRVALCPAMDEAITRALSTPAITEILSDANLPYFVAVAVLFVSLFAGWASEIKAFFTSRWLQQNDAADRMFEKRNISARKCCPSCSEQVPLSTLICDACDYNFLSGHGHKLLPAPQAVINETAA